MHRIFLWVITLSTYPITQSVVLGPARLTSSMNVLEMQILTPYMVIQNLYLTKIFGDAFVGSLRNTAWGSERHTTTFETVKIYILKNLLFSWITSQVPTWETKKPEFQLGLRVLSWFSPPAADLHFPQQRVLQDAGERRCSLWAFTIFHSKHTHTRLPAIFGICLHEGGAIKKYLHSQPHGIWKSFCLPHLQGPGIDLRSLVQRSLYTVVRLSSGPVTFLQLILFGLFLSSKTF